MNFVDAIKAAIADGKDTIEMRYADVAQPSAYISFVDSGATRDFVIALKEDNEILVCSGASVIMRLILRDDWYPSEMKRQTLLDIQRSVGSCARYG